LCGGAGGAAPSAERLKKDYLCFHNNGNFHAILETAMRATMREIALLNAAARCPDPRAIRMLLYTGAEVDIDVRDDDGQTPLMWAATKNRNPKVLEALIHAGADANARDSTGMTPLIAATAMNENPDTMRALIRFGADVNAGDDTGTTPLMAAVLMPLADTESERVELLLEAGASPHARCIDGCTALMYAAWSNRDPRAIELLLRAGAEANAVDIHGRTARDYLQENEALMDSAVGRRLHGALGQRSRG